MKNRRGFTLIELLVVIAIIAVLAAILFPVFARAKAAAKQATCTQNMNSIGKAFRMYASDNDDSLPTNRQPFTAANVTVSCLLSPPGHVANTPLSSANYVEGLSPYLEKLEDSRGIETVWRCPAASTSRYPATPTTNSYHVNASVTYAMSYYMAEQTEGRVDDAPNTLLMRETDRIHNALLRPYPSQNYANPSAPFNVSTNPPVQCSTAPTAAGTASQDAVGTLGFITPAVVQPRHSNGMMVLFVDGHVSYRSLSMLPPAKFDGAGTGTNVAVITPPAVGQPSGRWYVGTGWANKIWISP